MFIGYARVSTHKQNLDMQLDALKAAGCEKIFKDKISTLKEERQGLLEALDFLRPGDVLVVWKLDRLGRTLKQLIELVAMFNQKGIGFKSLKETIDTTTSTGKLVFHIFAALAEFERDIIHERTRAGLEAARARGRLGGRPKLHKPFVDHQRPGTAFSPALGIHVYKNVPSFCYILKGVDYLSSKRALLQKAKVDATSPAQQIAQCGKGCL